MSYSLFPQPHQIGLPRRHRPAMIEHQVQFALNLLDETVQMVRGNAHEAEFRPTMVNLAALCQVSVSEIWETTDKHQRLTFVNPGQVEFVPVDEILVSRILLNLLSNAVKYSPADTAIRLELDRRADWVILRVIDQGMGISEENLRSIFKPFFRAQEVHAISGTGLGLSIVRDCVERHKGRIHVESQLGKGTTFTVELPVGGA
jgi:signal transduction histidine kinase